MGKFKNILFQDVENPNESADGSITLRISVLVMMIYLLYLTYENHTRTALILYNIAMLGVVCFNVTLIGWDSGLQQAANTDTLTRLWNRHYLMHYMGKKVEHPDDFDRF